MLVELLKDHESGFKKGQVKDLHPLSAKRLIAAKYAVEKSQDTQGKTGDVTTVNPEKTVSPEVKEEKKPKETKEDKAAGGRETKDKK